MSRVCLFVFAAVIAGAFLAPSPRAAEHGDVSAATERDAAPVKRTILAVYDSRHEPSPSDTQIHELAEMPLNHLGYKLTYWDLQRELPDVSKKSDVAAVLAWFTQPSDYSLSFLQWMVAASDAGAKIILIGDIEFESNWANRALVDLLFSRLGLSYSGDWIEATYSARIAELDGDVLSFERPLTAPLPPFPVVRPVSPHAEAHVALSVPGTDGEISAVVATGPGGGFAASNYVIYHEPTLNRMKWLVNPFTFFAKALDNPVFPVPDVTTVSGRRLYFSHIDGDGWNNISEIEKYRATHTTSAEVILKELIAPYPDLPVTVGLIAGDIEPDLGGRASAAEVARQLFALPQVEVASHTYTHPFTWSFFEAYDRDEELALIEQNYVDDRSIFTRYVDQISTAKGGHSQARQRYVSGSDALPRVYMKEPFDLDREVAGALAVSEAVAPEGKRAAVYLWSGDTTPFEAALRVVRETGAKNMNGGDSRFDMEWPSIAYVPPISRTVGKERQIYAVNSNENTYTNDWTGPFYGQALLSETLKNTDSARRLKGINVYYHMYAGEKPASLAALRGQIERARNDHITPITASRYAAIAEGFFDTRIVRTGPRTWRISDRGALNTVRFDRPDGYVVDLEESEGVTGYTFHNGSLYVTLDPTVDTVDLSLVHEKGLATKRYASPRLIDSRWIFSNVKRTACGIEADVVGFGPGEIHVGGLKPGTYELSVSRHAAVVWRGEATAAGDGNLTAIVSADARSPLHLRMDCR